MHEIHNKCWIYVQEALDYVSDQKKVHEIWVIK